MRIYKLLTMHGLPPTVLNVETWPDLDPDFLPPHARDRYRRFKAAIVLVVTDRITISAAARKTGIDRSELHRILARCFEPAADGRIEGFRVLVPYRRLKRYERRRSTKGGTAGIFELLLEQCPSVAERLWVEYRSGESYQSIHTLLLDELLPAVGWPTHAYPYNTESKGRGALRGYLIRRQKRETTSRWAQIDYSGEAKTVVRPFERVELDAHKCDAIFVVHFEGPDGLTRPAIIERIWLLVLIDVASRAILGYSLVLDRQCSIPDILEAFHTAVVPQPRRTLTIPGLEYKPGAGFPNQLIPITAWQLFDLVCLDNAMAHTSPRLHAILAEKTQANIRLNRTRSPNDNALVERFFGTLTAHGFQRVPSTTGSSPQDLRRKNAETSAMHYEFTLQEAEELLEVLISNYNVEMHRGIHSSPLNYLQTFVKQTQPVTRHVLPAHRSTWSCRELWVEVTVRGSEPRGKTPYIQYEDAIYRSILLSQSAEYIGQKLLLRVNLTDLRTVQAFWHDGREFGLLQVTGSWAISRHSLHTRRLANKLSRAKAIHIGYRDPVNVLKSYLQDKAVHQRWARNQLVKLYSEMDLGEISTEESELCEVPQIDRPNRDDWLSFRSPIYD
jgi:transposase InsO family protein